MVKKADTKRILVIAAHPDDEVLGCGGAIARHVREEDRVCVLILGTGIAARKEVSTAAGKRMIVELEKDARNASKILGVEKLIMRSFPDNAFDSVPLLEIIHAIEEAIDEFSPEIIYTHHFADVNIDHRRTVEAVESAMRPMHDSAIESVFSFEVASSTEWNFIRPTAFRPNVFVALTEADLNKKCEALKKYASEIRLFPHPRSIEYLTALAQVRGGQSGSKQAEGFVLVYQRT